MKSLDMGYQVWHIDADGLLQNCQLTEVWIMLVHIRGILLLVKTMNAVVVSKKSNLSFKLTSQILHSREMVQTNTENLQSKCFCWKESCGRLPFVIFCIASTYQSSKRLILAFICYLVFSWLWLLALTGLNKMIMLISKLEIA